MASWKSSNKRRRRGATITKPPTTKDAQGRVHLVLQTDGSARFASGLTGPLFAEPWQDTLTVTTANAAFRHLGMAPEGPGLEALTTEAMAALSKLVEGLAAQSQTRVQCAAGCAHCCHQSVGVTGIEAITIVRHLRKSRTAEELTSLTQRVREMSDRTRGMTYKERHSPHLPCVFLGPTGNCTIYAVRPLVCRAVNSLDAETCRDNLHDENKRTAYLESGQGAPALIAPVRASHAISAGLQLAGADVYGLDMRPLDLVAAVDLLLGDEGIESRWLSGERALENAGGSDASANVRLREVAGLDRSGS